MLDKVRELPEDVVKAAGTMMRAGLGVVTVAQEESTRLFDTLVERGRAFDPHKYAVASTLRSARADAVSTWHSLRDRVGDGLDTAMHRVNLPTEAEIEVLLGKIEKLSVAVEKLRAARERAVVAAPVPKVMPAGPKAEPKVEAKPPAEKAGVKPAPVAPKATAKAHKTTGKPHKPTH